MTENEARERLIDAIHGEQANYCGPGYGTCGSVTLAKAEASDLVGLILAALRADPALAAAALGGEVEFGVRMDVGHEHVEAGAVLAAIDRGHAAIVSTTWVDNRWPNTIVGRCRGPWTEVTP